MKDKQGYFMKLNNKFLLKRFEKVGCFALTELAYGNFPNSIKTVN